MEFLTAIPTPLPSCRICFESEVESGQKLIVPCGCKGSARWICVVCFRAWLSHANDDKRCGTCREVYDEAAVDAAFPSIAELERDAIEAKMAYEIMIADHERLAEPLRAAVHLTGRVLYRAEAREERRRRPVRSKSPERILPQHQQRPPKEEIPRPLQVLIICGFILFYMYILIDLDRKFSVPLERVSPPSSCGVPKIS